MGRNAPFLLKRGAAALEADDAGLGAGGEGNMDKNWHKFDNQPTNALGGPGCGGQA